MKTYIKAMAVAWTAAAVGGAPATGADLQLTGIETTNGVKVTGSGGLAGNRYDLQWAESLLGKAPWETVGSSLAGEDGSFGIVDEALNGPGFYSVQENARQIARTGIDSAMQDCAKAVRSLDSLSDTKYDMLLSGDFRWNSTGSQYQYSDIPYGSTNLWMGEAFNWLPPSITSDSGSIDLRDIEDMEWLWVRQVPNMRSRILGRYAYVCFNISGFVDANFLGLDYGTDLPANGYGDQTHRNNVRRMLLNGVRAHPSTDPMPQLTLARFQERRDGFSTPAELNQLTDHVIGYLPPDHLSCYSRAVLHKGAGYGAKKPCTAENIVYSTHFSRLVNAMGGAQADVCMALEDYTSTNPVPVGTDYPSVKAVPMFNEIKAEVRLVQAGDTGKWQLEVTLKPEFWCPFPSEDTPKNVYTLLPPSIGGDATQSGDADVWIRFIGLTSSGRFQPTLVQRQVTPAQLDVEPTTTPVSSGEFTYLLDIEGLPAMEDGSTPDIRKLQVAGVFFQTPWTLQLDGIPADSTPAFAITVSPNTLSATNGNTIGSGFLEVDDPRLNHLAERWFASTDGTMNAPNSCLAAARYAAKSKMGFEPGSWMYCRNGRMESPAELGYIPIYDGSTPWMTLDNFSDDGIALMNSLVCDDAAWTALADTGVFCTNGTINPYTRDAAVLNGAFYGLDIREVPNMKGRPSGTSDCMGMYRTRDLSEQLLKDKDPDGNAFTKDGPGGWTRVLRYKGFDFNKNERVALAHNTWGLFNESDSLFLVFVIAQSITEAPEEVDLVGTWNETADMICGERVAVALCWMDTSAEAISNPAPTMEIIAFKYLDE
jgi:hypothetical protein